MGWGGGGGGGEGGRRLGRNVTETEESYRELSKAWSVPEVKPKNADFTEP